MSETRANDGSDLIVDFGDRRRLSETDGEVPAATRQVSFIKDIVVHYFQYPSTDEVTKRWNSKKDKAKPMVSLARVSLLSEYWY